MNCEDIKSFIPSYIKHTATEDQIKYVEEHLCLCNTCRDYLAQTMDNIPLQQNAQEITNPLQPNHNETIIAPAGEKKPSCAQEKIIQETITTETKKPISFEYLILGISIIILMFFIFLFINK